MRIGRHTTEITFGDSRNGREVSRELLNQVEEVSFICAIRWLTLSDAKGNKSNNFIANKKVINRWIQR